MNLDIPPPLGKTGYASEESGLKNSVFRLPLHVPFIYICCNLKYLI